VLGRELGPVTGAALLLPQAEEQDREGQQDGGGDQTGEDVCKIVASGMVASWVREMKCPCGMGRARRSQDDRTAPSRVRRSKCLEIGGRSGAGRPVSRLVAGFLPV
jgi:hypothetical protein